MNVLIVGSGGREHALTWKVAQSPEVGQIYCAPGNPGMASLAECVDIGVNDFDALIAFAKEHEVGLTIIGPEVPLAGGIVDRFKEAGLRAFGPCAAAARIEASKAFAKDFMARHHIPTAAYRRFDDATEAIAYIEEKGAPLVVKADGLAAGKGVTVAHDVAAAVAAVEDAMVKKVFGDAGDAIIVEEFLEGEEVSIFALTDGQTILSLIPSQDHKPVGDGDTGPNTGGMGAYAPAPVVDQELLTEIGERVLRRCVDGMTLDGHPYTGVLYAGLMISEAGPKVVEFNCRFGDPETQVVLPLLTSDIVPLMVACCDGDLAGKTAEGIDAACVTVVMSSGGYPGSYEKGKAIVGIEEAESMKGITVFHAGTQIDRGDLATNGGRVLNVTATGPDIKTAIEMAYAAVKKISFDGAHYRRDIGTKALERLGVAGR